MGNVLAFPKLHSPRADGTQLAWQAQQGMPSEEAALVTRLEVLAGSRGDGLGSWTLYRLDALLTFAGWRGDDDA